jgi:hypothetical protein
MLKGVEDGAEKLGAAQAVEIDAAQAKLDFFRFHGSFVIDGRNAGVTASPVAWMACGGALLGEAPPTNL